MNDVEYPIDQASRFAWDQIFDKTNTLTFAAGGITHELSGTMADGFRCSFANSGANEVCDWSLITTMGVSPRNDLTVQPQTWARDRDLGLRAGERRYRFEYAMRLDLNIKMSCLQQSESYTYSERIDDAYVDFITRWQKNADSELDVLMAYRGSTLPGELPTPRPLPELFTRDGLVTNLYNEIVTLVPHLPQDLNTHFLVWIFEALRNVQDLVNSPIYEQPLKQIDCHCPASVENGSSLLRG